MHYWKLTQVRRCFATGGLLAYPTEAVYGLGCDPLRETAVWRLLDLKQRPVDKGLILIAADFDQLRQYLRPVSDELLRPVLASWPGPHTWLLPAAADAPRWLTGRHQSLAVRVTAHPIASALCRACESALVSTSANRAGRPPLRSAIQVQKAFSGSVDFLLHGAVGGLARPTPIRDAVSGHPIRQ